MRVSELESALLARFPVEQAESWDRVGLSVGRADDEVTGVVCALDATLDTVEATAACGANVLLTHHPLFLEPPQRFVQGPGTDPVAASICRAVELGVSVISLHTNLDRSMQVRELLPGLLPEIAITPGSLTSLEHHTDPSMPALGSLFDMEAVPLARLAQRCSTAFGRTPRAWGEPECPVRRVAMLGGSLGSFGELALDACADVVICGEAGYHTVLSLVERGLAVILLGHGISEQPFCSILRDAALAAGISPDSCQIIERPRTWWSPCEGGTE